MVESADLGGFSPYNEAHAIVSCVLGIQFPAQISTADWPKIRKGAVAGARDLELGAPQPFYSFSLSFDGSRTTIAVGGPAPLTNEISGITFARVGEDDRPTERIIVARDALIFSNHAYVRWEAFFDRVAQFLNHVFPEFTSLMPCSGVKLEYFDRFDAIVPTPATGMDMFKIIERDSGYLSPHAAAAADPWHSYAGYFERMSKEVRRLVNIRLDAGDFPSVKDGQVQRSIIIYTMLNDANDQHTALKILLSRMLTVDAAKRIGLVDVP
jgi:hypothetical protein